MRARATTIPTVCRRMLAGVLLLALLVTLAAGPAFAHGRTRGAGREKAHCRPVRTRHRHATCTKAVRASKRTRTKPKAPPAPKPAAAPKPAPAVARQVVTAPSPPAPSGPAPALAGPASPPLAPGPLRWAPPALVNPITVTLGTGYTRTTLSPTRDYVVKLPPTEKLGGTWIIGGHNVVIVGGAISIPANLPAGSANDAQRTGIYVKDATGTVHVEGVLIDGAPGAQFDGVDIDAPQATVQLENLRVVGVQGGFSSFHADVVQPWGGVHDLRIDHLTGISNYQGLTLQQDLGPIGSAELSNVDLTATAIAPVDGGGHMLWLTTDQTCRAYPMTFSNVYVQPRPGRTLANSVWPQSNAPTACTEAGSLLATWPLLPFSGGVTAGAPAGGSFVPAGAAGLDYRSPGYAGS